MNEFIRLTEIEAISRAVAPWHDNCVHLPVSWTTIIQLTKLIALEYKTYEDIYTKHKHREEKQA